VVSNWEHGVRQPNGLQLEKLAAIYRLSVDELVQGGNRHRPDFERLMFRDAGSRLGARGKYEIQRFLAFLDSYSGFLAALGEPPGLVRSPFSVVEGFTSREDVRRKAAEARNFFALGTGPVGDPAGLSDLYGITVYRVPSGQDLKETVSGAFLPHDRAGFAILLNGETTPGRQQFTLAHELGHALFQGDKLYVAYYGRREAAERFADAFAAEFLAPTPALRAAVEGFRLTKVRDAEVVVHLQRLFRVSYAMMLVRLRAAGLITGEDLERFRSVRPTHLAERLGYSLDPDESMRQSGHWDISRYPRRFLRLLRSAFHEGAITLSGAAAMTGLVHEDIEDFLADEPAPDVLGDYEYLDAVI